MIDDLDTFIARSARQFADDGKDAEIQQLRAELARRNDDVLALRQQLAAAHEAIGAARAVLHELDASGNYPHSSVAIGVVLMALEKALQ